tara:strand:+ start:1908 stop:2807 length:900 start_codon:yes stop_codon:yes gene_type:complete
MDSIERKDLNTEGQNFNSKNIDELSTIEILEVINREDKLIADKVAGALGDIEKTVHICTNSIKSGGSIFYIGAGTSGRLGVLDASEIPPTFSAPPDLFKGIIAGGDQALRKSIEGAEDSPKQAIVDLKAANLQPRDVLIGISTSGAARYVQSALRYAKSIETKTVYLLCNKTPFLQANTDVTISVDTGAEVITGSTRMKGGTATKMVLNMISTACMVKLGKVYGNLMVDLMAVNEKLIDRGVRIINQLTKLDYEKAKEMLIKSDMSVKTAIVMVHHSCELDKAKRIIEENNGNLRKIIQ